jgi:hypothetical protein
MTNSIKAPMWFMLVVVLAVIWDAMGVMTYISTMTISPEAMAQMSEAEQVLHNTTPAWANGAFAIAVFGGLLGSLLLLIKKAWALPVLIISLIAILLQMFNAFFIMDSYAVLGPTGTIMPIVVILIAILLVWLAISAKSKNWIS